MKNVWRVLGILALVGVAAVIVRAIKQYRQDNVFDLPPSNETGMGSAPDSNKRISPELLEILADPADKGPVELMEIDGKEWLVNRRNGYRYPVEEGIPIMLIEEGEKNKDETLISLS